MISTCSPIELEGILGQKPRLIDKKPYPEGLGRRYCTSVAVRMSDPELHLDTLWHLGSIISKAPRLFTDSMQVSFL